MRLVALPLYNGGVRAVYETIVLDVGNGASVAYTSFVDARSGEIIMRLDRSQDSGQETPARDQYARRADLRRLPGHDDRGDQLRPAA
ncbi:MAG: hypothetical protein WKF58_00100 [Ilumatobacteraceae bacterium]